LHIDFVVQWEEPAVHEQDGMDPWLEASLVDGGGAAERMASQNNSVFI